MLELGNDLRKSGVDTKFLDLIRLRVSQFNGCAYCIDMRWKDLRAGGETEHRHYTLDASRESPYYTGRERAALAWAEAVTLVAQLMFPTKCSTKLAVISTTINWPNLTLGVVAINGWDRLKIAYRTTPGTYRPAAREKHGSAN